jgi:hypothetical protein
VSARAGTPMANASMVEINTATILIVMSDSIPYYTNHQPMELA